MPTQPATTEGLVRIETAAAFLDISPWTIMYWLRTGKLRGVKVGRAWRLHRADLEALATPRDTTRDAGEH